MQSARFDPLASARRLRHAELNNGGILASGERMTALQREYWRAALARELERESEAPAEQITAPPARIFGPTDQAAEPPSWTTENVEERA
jgi:hypothetical protein